MAVTGGADWEVLASPIKATGVMYYVLFIFYIAFAAFAVLNVLTGMFVDTAMKVSEKDDADVAKEQEDSTLKEQEEMKCFFEGLPENSEGCTSRLTMSMLQRNEEAPAVVKFFQKIELTVFEGEQIYKMLHTGDEPDVDIQEFIDCCVQGKSSIQDIHMVTLMSETKRFAKHFAMSMEYMEERFNEVLTACAHGRNKHSQVEPIHQRWANHHRRSTKSKL
jgi:hypothetical protein